MPRDKEENISVERKTPGVSSQPSLVLSSLPCPRRTHRAEEMGTEEEDAYGFFSWALWLGGRILHCVSGSESLNLGKWNHKLHECVWPSLRFFGRVIRIP